MSRFSSQYQISRPTGRCAATDTPLEPGMAIVACLVDREDDEGFERLDYTQEAWESGARPERLFSYWRTVMPAPDDKPKLLVDDAVLMDLFERLVDDTRPRRQAFRFVLALILIRKRLLKFEGRVQIDGDEHWQVRSKGTDPESPPITVFNPQLGDDDVLELTSELGEVLQGEF
jgi:hypothetical protein